MKKGGMLLAHTCAKLCRRIPRKKGNEGDPGFIKCRAVYQEKELSLLFLALEDSVRILYASHMKNLKFLYGFMKFFRLVHSSKKRLQSITAKKFVASSSLSISSRAKG